LGEYFSPICCDKSGAPVDSKIARFTFLPYFEIYCCAKIPAPDAPKIFILSSLFKKPFFD